jgi:hypothetical protein
MYCAAKWNLTITDKEISNVVALRHWEKEMLSLYQALLNIIFFMAAFI